MKEESTYGVKPQSLARLLSMGKRGGETGKTSPPGPTPGELLRDILSRKLPLDPASPDSLPALLDCPSDELLAVSDHTIGDLLLGSNTGLAILIAVKDYGKALARRGGPQQVAATAVYYAAIASALVFHGRRISQHSYEKLHKGYAEYEQKPWASSELKHLFQRVRAVCEQQERKPG